MLVGFACLGVAPAPALAAHVVRVTAEHSSIDLGTRLDARVELSTSYDNPFDPDEVAVDAMVVTPSGTVHRLPAFWDRDTQRALVDGREVITASGPGYFHVRYAPVEVGRHELSVVARDAAGQDVSAATIFEVGAGDARGSVHIDDTDRTALAYDDGTPFVAIGANVCWSTDPSAGYDMEAYLGQVADAGGTWARLWMTHFGEGWTIEWAASHPSGYYAGLGRYSVEVGSRLDRVFEYAQSRGIAIQLVLWQHSQLETENWSSWSDNPYNAANGGPAASSAEFFQNPTAVALSQRRIRYLVGRYAAYRSLFAWEVMNEQDGVKAPSEIVAAWSKDRARELKQADPYQHLVTTSFLVRPYLGALSSYESDAFDIVQAHAYGGSLGFAIPKDVAALRKFGKPMVFGEFGLDYLGEVELTDPRGVHLSEGSWIALASGYSSGAMSWWWDTYLRPNDLWATQRGIAAFVRKVSLLGLNAPLPEAVVAENADATPFDVFGRSGDSGAVLYVRDPDARWEVAKAAAPARADGVRVLVPCDANKRCEASSYDTSTGDVLGEPVTLQGGAQGLVWMALPGFVGSIAVHVRRLPEALVDPPSSSGGCSVASGPVPTDSAAGALALIALLGRALRRRKGDQRPSSSTP